MLALTLTLATIACIVGPLVVAKAIKNWADDVADPDDADPDFCGWYDTGPDLPIPDAVVIRGGR